MFIAANFKPTLSNDKQSDHMHATERRWFALRVGHRKEKVVKKLLEGAGVECFLPIRDRPFKYRSKTGVRQIPLLGGYLFVRVVLGEVSTVLKPSFVFGFVKMGRYHKQVTEAEIALLQRLSSDHRLEWEVEAIPLRLSSGSPVEIARGPLAGVRGHYVEQKNKKTFIISFGGLDARLTTCEVSPDMIIPLKGGVIESGNHDR